MCGAACCVVYEEVLRRCLRSVCVIGAEGYSAAGYVWCTTRFWSVIGGACVRASGCRVWCTKQIFSKYCNCLTAAVCRSLNLSIVPKNFVSKSGVLS